MKEKKVTSYDEYRTTTNTNVYSRLHKKVLEKKGKIRCTYCAYHKNENDKGKYYGQTIGYTGKKYSRYPNWKLASKKTKQWMDGTYSEVKRYNRFSREYIVELKI